MQMTSTQRDIYGVSLFLVLAPLWVPVFVASLAWFIGTSAAALAWEKMP